METAIVYWVYMRSGMFIVILKSSMLGLHRDNGKELGNYYLGVRARVTAVGFL